MQGTETEWIDHEYYKTYEIAARLNRIAYRGDVWLSEQFGDPLDFFVFVESPWSQVTAVHHVVRAVAHEMFLRETEGPYVDRWDELHTERLRILSVDACLARYGLADTTFAIPSPPRQMVQISKNVTSWEESDLVADACYDYFINDVALSAAYDELLGRIADEVFFTVFNNRQLLMALNLEIADRVARVGDEDVDNEHDPREWRKGPLLARSSRPQDATSMGSQGRVSQRQG